MAVESQEVCDCCGRALYVLSEHTGQWLCDDCAVLLSGGDSYVAENDVVPYVFT